ncbi:TVP38/TMEM64 family protein [Rudanella lutea]|jgi:uncharacterized membrane protein YdjX (TVP38/TMEM64 family)|uniref:TVP38/TMEM64 family protein n=1 Tax=Rudanella lutea TaxID=451374 RepID=UPI0003719E0B|nr:VTT domain-containing protein [Rudanella lutea]
MSDSTEHDFHKLIQYLPLILTVLLVGGLGVAYVTVPAFSQFIREAFEVLSSDDRPRISEWVSQFGWRGPLIIVAAMVAQIFMVVVPSFVLIAVSMLAYGPVNGTLISLVASGVAATVGYGVGSGVGEAMVRRLVGDKTERKAGAWVRENGFWSIVFARMTPFISGDAISLVGGLSGLSYPKFITATLLGVTPLTLLIAYFSRSQDLMRKGFIGLTIVSGLLLLGYWFGRRIKKAAMQD